MTVKDLISELEQFDGDLEVKFSFDYGDRTHTQVAQDVKNVDEGKTEFSSYHLKDKVVECEDQDEFNCVIIS